jgi:hypothetical protein
MPSVTYTPNQQRSLPPPWPKFQANQKIRRQRPVWSPSVGHRTNERLGRVVWIRCWWPGHPAGTNHDCFALHRIYLLREETRNLVQIGRHRIDMIRAFTLRPPTADCRSMPTLLPSGLLQLSVSPHVMWAAIDLWRGVRDHVRSIDRSIEM